jgi:hypothetical protein
MVTSRIGSSFFIILSLLACSRTALAHHSFTAEFEGAKVVTLTGTLTRVEWINPHTYFYIDVKDSSGNVTTWSIESNPTSMMHRAGATRSMFTEGEVVTVQINPAKDGTKALGSLRHIKFQNGNEMNFKNNNDPPPDAK